MNLIVCYSFVYNLINHIIILSGMMVRPSAQCNKHCLIPKLYHNVYCIILLLLLYKSILDTDLYNAINNVKTWYSVLV